MDEMEVGPYRLRLRLCASPAGEVFLASDAEGKDLVVRIFPPAIASDDERLERVLYDARAASGLDDPRIERTVDAGRAEGRAFLAAEPMGGPSLAATLRSEGRLPAREVARIGLELAEILARAHAHGVSHRGIEPEHVYLIGAERSVRLAGFGLAAALERAPATRGLDQPAAPYLAPEQIRGEHADHRADFCALGAVLWESLTGAPPGSPPDTKHVPENAPPVVFHMLLALLSPDPGARPAALSEIARAFREILAIPDGEPPSEPGAAPGAAPPGATDKRELPSVGPVRGALLVLGGVAAAGALRLLLRRRR